MIVVTIGITTSIVNIVTTDIIVFSWLLLLPLLSSVVNIVLCIYVHVYICVSVSAYLCMYIYPSPPRTYYLGYWRP